MNTKAKKRGRRPKFMDCDSIFAELQPGILWGARAIAADLNICEKTLYNWIQKHQLPVRYSPGGVMWTFRGEIRLFLYAYSEQLKGRPQDEIRKDINAMVNRTVTCPECGCEF